jgi:hypothetical protein
VNIECHKPRFVGHGPPPLEKRNYKCVQQGEVSHTDTSTIESRSTGSGKRSDGAVKHSDEFIRLKWVPTALTPRTAGVPIGFPAAQ